MPTEDGAIDIPARLKGLGRQEIAACVIAERILGATAEAWDINGRTGVVDAMLTLPDGRRAAFEITNLAAPGALQTESILARDKHKWPIPGKWFWNIEVGSAKDLPKLKSWYQQIVLACEEAGITDPERIGWDPASPVEIRWLVQHSSSRMSGHPEVRIDTMKIPGTSVVPAMGGGAVDSALSGFAEAIQTAFDDASHIGEHFDKLAKADADERHLFIPLHDTALPFPVSNVLMFDDNLPPDAPPLPRTISHLWLAPSFSRRVLIWSEPEGWRNVRPYDN